MTPQQVEAAQRLQLALAAGSLGDWSWDAAADTFALGERAAAVHGLGGATQLTWTRLCELVHADDRQPLRDALQRALADGSDFEFAYRLVRDGLETWIAARGRPLRNPDGTSGMVGVMQDATDQKRIEELRNRLAAVVEGSDDAIVSKDLQGIVRTWNAGAERIFGWTAAEIVGQPILRLIPAERQSEEDTILATLRRGERIDHYETVRITKDGRRIDVSLTVSPVRDAAGRVVGASKIARDITAKKRAEAELRRSEAELRALADSIPQLAWMAHADGDVFWYNRGWYEYTGTTPEQMRGWGWQAVHDPAVLPAVVQRWRQSLATGEAFEMEFPLRGRDGAFRWFLTRIRPIRDADGRVVRWFGTNTDLDEQKRAREALADESRLLQLLHETWKVIAADLDVRTLMQTVTDAATQLSGAQFGAFFHNTTDETGASYTLFTLAGADRSQFESFGMPRATPLFEPTYRGERIVRLDDVTADPRYGQWGGMPEGHLPVRSYLAVPIVSRRGDVLGGLFFGHSNVGVFGDRAERLVTAIAAQAAIAMDNARLYESQKRTAEDRQHLLEAERNARAELERTSLLKDEFLATLSHELRTPLNAIVGWAQVLRTRRHADAEVLEGLAVIDRNARAQTQLIDDLLDMSRIVSGKLRLDVQRVDLQDAVRAAVASVRHSAEAKGLRLHTVLDESAGPVWGDPNRLQQCFWNLLTNAIKFTSRGGRVHVTLARVNSHVEVTIADTGQGIAPEFLPHLFQRFRQADGSTTRQHGGLGLGLSIVRSLVEMHGGTVRASSPGIGQGATFRIELPVMPVHPGEATAPGDTAPAAPVEHPSLAGITVLAIDDDADARDLVRRVLEDCGARVFVAASSAEGLALLQEHRPDLVISDIGMAGTDGYEFIRQVRRLPPEQGGRTPAAALSAFARPEDRTRALRAGYQLHLAKPVEPTELTAVVASLASR